MNIEKLRKLFDETDGDLVVKNYPALCEILEVKPKKGGKNSSLHQLEFDRYFKYDKQGHQFIIKEIYAMARDKIDNRGANGKYTDNLQEIILQILAQDTRGELLFSGNVLLKKLNMVNCNYGVGRRNVPKLAELINVDTDIIYDFYNTTNSNLLDSVETALKRLRSRRLIMWEKVIVVAKIKAERNDLGEVKLTLSDDNDEKAIAKTSLDYRQATLEEKQIILDIEKSVLAQMGFRNTQQAFLGGMWTKYKQRVNMLVREKLNIKFHFEGYLLTYNHRDVIEEVENEDLTFLRMISVNKTVVDSVKTNAENKHKNSKDKQATIEEYKKEFELYSMEELHKMGVKKCRMMAYDKIRVVDNFVDDTIKIADTVINAHAKNITLALSEKPLKEDNNTNNTNHSESDNNELPF